MNMTVTNIAARLEIVIGADRVNGSAESCAKFAVDGVVPSAVASPASCAEAVEMVRFAKSEKLALIPCGNCTKLGIGMPPARYDSALDMTGLDQIAYYDPGDLTLSVDAGMHLRHLADALAQQQQFVPLAVPFFEGCSVGGTIASNIGSSLRPGYGSARDFLLGAEFVNGAGTLTKSGGRVVKNVTGYDLHKLLIGSLGTLAVITRLNFRTFPLPPAQQTFLASFATAPEALSFCAAIAKSPLQPKLVEVLDRGTARLFAARGCTRASRDAWSAVITAAGQQAVVERHARDLERMAGDIHASEFAPLNDSEQAALLACI